MAPTTCGWGLGSMQQLCQLCYAMSGNADRIDTMRPRLSVEHYLCAGLGEHRLDERMLAGLEADDVVSDCRR